MCSERRGDITKFTARQIMTKEQKIYAYRILRSEQEITLRDRLYNDETKTNLCTADKLVLFKKTQTFTVTTQSNRNSP